MSVTVPGISTTPYAYHSGSVADTYGVSASVGTNRGLGSNWFNNRAIAHEDWIRAEQAQNNQLARDLYFQNQANLFNAGEAQKQRDYDERMSSTQYQRAITDMKKAGINPVLAVQHGASFAGGSSATSGGSRTASGNTSFYGADQSMANLFSSILKFGAGLYSKGFFSGAQTASKITKKK